MTVNLSQIQLNEPRLLPETYTQNTSDDSFQRQLDNEQKRLVIMFSPYGQIDFNSWFSYSDLSVQSQPRTSRASLFSDIEFSPAENHSTNSYYSAQTENIDQPSAADRSFSRIADHYFGRQAQPVLQDILARTGWLTPNIAARPDMLLAQLDGKLLSKLDLQHLVDEIVSQVKMVQAKGRTELTLGLKPENLGEILMTLIARSGMISIEIQANDEVKKLIQAQLRDLEIALKKAKVNVADIKVVSSEEVSPHA